MIWKNKEGKMPINTKGNLWIFCLNVGQGDTTIVATPNNKILIIDAFRGTKILTLLNDLGMLNTDPITHIIITHPHSDHYNGIDPILNTYRTINGISLTSLRHVDSNTPSYNNIINTAVSKGIPINFLSGYTQMYPDQSPVIDTSTLQVELLGPSNQYIEDLYQSGNLNPNHYSIITRLNWCDVHIIIAGDAQMETWAHFDSEQMMMGPCSVLRAAHHGSANGTQYERIERLKPKVSIVSSEPYGKDEIPDLIGAATFLRYSKEAHKPIVALTDNQDNEKTGTIKVDVNNNGKLKIYYYGDKKEQNIVLGNEKLLTYNNNPTDWQALTIQKM
jgi:competence protein ComEC